MRHALAAGGLILACLASLTAPAVAGAAACAPATSGVLRLSDMPTGYTVKKPPHATPPDTSSATPVQAANIRRNRLAGCDSEYEHSPAPQVSSTVSQWRSVASAVLALRLGIASAQSGLKWKRASQRERIGDQATLLVGQIKRRGFTFDACTVVWRSGVLLKSVILVGLAMQAEPETCVRLAERQQQHRTRAG